MTLVTCRQCGAKNRVDEQTSRKKQPICGRCGTHLELTGQGQTASGPVEVTDSTFINVISGAGHKPVLIDCWAEWCPPCKMLTPTIDALARESNGRWVIAKLDVDHNPRIANEFRIGSIPTMLIFKDGELKDQLVGLQPKGAIESRLAGIA